MRIRDAYACMRYAHAYALRCNAYTLHVQRVQRRALRNARMRVARKKYFFASRARARAARNFAPGSAPGRSRARPRARPPLPAGVLPPPIFYTRHDMTPRFFFFLQPIRGSINIARPPPAPNLVFAPAGAKMRALPHFSTRDAALHDTVVCECPHSLGGAPSTTRDAVHRMQRSCICNACIACSATLALPNA